MNTPVITIQGTSSILPYRQRDHPSGDRRGEGGEEEEGRQRGKREEGRQRGKREGRWREGTITSRWHGEDDLWGRSRRGVTSRVRMVRIGGNYLMYHYGESLDFLPLVTNSLTSCCVSPPALLLLVFFSSLDRRYFLLFYFRYDGSPVSP